MLWVGQFGIVDGEAREDTPWVGAYPEATRGEEPADLYVVVQPALPGSEEFCGELREALAAVFRKSVVTLTGGLLTALRSAHEDLREWNRRSLRDHRVAAGVSCVAVRSQEGGSGGHEAYLAQVGPAAAVLRRDGLLAQMRPALPDALEPIGLHEEFWPEFSRLDLGTAARLLLLTPPLLDSLTADDLHSVLSSAPEDALPALYRHAREAANCAALLIAVVPPPPAVA